MHDYHYSARMSQLADLEESIRGSILRVEKISVINSGDGVSIGNHFLISPKVVTAATNHEFANSKTLIPLQGLKQIPTWIFIGKDAWIGFGSTILNNAIIKGGCVIAAKSTIKRSSRTNCVYTGDPSRVIGQKF